MRACEFEENDRVRSLDDEHRATHVLGWVDEVGGGPDGVTVHVTWDDGRWEWRLAEEVEIVDVVCSACGEVHE